MPFYWDLTDIWSLYVTIIVLNILQYFRISVYFWGSMHQLVENRSCQQYVELIFSSLCWIFLYLCSAWKKHNLFTTWKVMGEEAEGIYCIWNTKGYLKTWWKASVRAKGVLFLVQARVESVLLPAHLPLAGQKKYQPKDQGTSSLQVIIHVITSRIFWQRKGHPSWAASARVCLMRQSMIIDVNFCLSFSRDEFYAV